VQTDLRNPITSWQEEERPREKLILKGKSSLSNKELLAILIGSGTPQTSAVGLSEQILHYVHHDLVQLGKLNINDLMRFNGVGEAKAIRVVASMELGRRRQADGHLKVNIIKSSKDIYILLLSDLSDLISEEFWVIFLNHRNKIIGKKRISSGGLTATVVDVRILFKEAIERLATAIVIAHNHPSGTLKPSRADIQLTQKIKNASKLLDIQLLDHLIVADSGYYSFADDGCL
tara:strand:- start:1841 stop:2536 length:696 start_codon:yes stop_codon:yes gene_type:complete